MTFVEISKGLLFLVLAICAAGVSFFVCWNLYYLVKTTQTVYKAASKTHDIVGQVEEAVRLLRGKTVFTASCLVLVTEGLTKLSKVMKKSSDPFEDD